MIKIICVGKVKEKYLRDGIDDYLKRIINTLLQEKQR